MSDKSNFEFITDKSLRRNIDITFNHIIDLIAITENESNNELSKSSLRKSIIIATGSIVEGMLYYIVDKKFSNIDVQNHFSYEMIKHKKILYEDTIEKKKIIAGEWISVPDKSKKKSKLNLGQMNSILKDKGVIDETIYEKIDYLREKRNQQHLGAQKGIKEYNSKDMEKCFEVASMVKIFASSLNETISR